MMPDWVRWVYVFGIFVAFFWTVLQSESKDEPFIVIAAGVLVGVFWPAFSVAYLLVRLTSGKQ
jgi:hypothetical protein